MSGLSTTDEPLGKAYGGLLSSVVIGVAIFDRAGRSLVQNSAFCRMLGVPDELERRALPADFLPIGVVQQLAQLSNTRDSRLTYVNRPPRDPEKPALLLMAAVGLAGGDGGSVALFFEIAAAGGAKDRDSDLAHRMAAIGKLAAGVAHEINNPLAYAMGNLSFAIESLQTISASTPELGIVLVALRDALEGTERVRRTIRDLKAFARPESDGQNAVDLEKVVRAAASLAATEIRHRARLIYDFDVVPAVRANEAQLAQVLLSLLINAAHAIPDGNVENNEIRVTLRQTADDRVTIDIRDTGRGLTPEALHKVFDPFSESRATEEGTGLDLAICHRFVNEGGGDITAESAVAHGSTFRVSLPIAHQAMDSLRAPSRTELRQRARVLVVDDEPRIGSTITRILAPLHEVTAVCSAKDALLRLERDEDYDVILCDVMMPQMSGSDLYQALVLTSPRMVKRMVFMTGGPFSSRGATFLENVPNPRLEKPFSPEALRKLVQNSLR